MACTLTLKTATTVPIEVEGLTPDALRNKPLREIERVPIFYGNRQLPLAELFTVRGDADDETLVFAGDMANVHWIGAKMKSGMIRMEGDAGRHLGSQMRGGEIHVHGSAGDWVGGEMHGGLIRVHGSAGDMVGAAYRGSVKGMTQGTILIDGDAGEEVGHTMRRGLIAIGGQVGDFVGFNMLAGTILIGGTPGIRHGAGMRRGTIGFLGSQPATLLPSFRRTCRFRPPFLPLLSRQLAAYDFPLPSDALASDFELFAGDLVAGGRGEILLRAI